VVEMENPVETVARAFDEIRYDLNKDIDWFAKTLPDIVNCFVFIQKHVMSARDLLKHYERDWIEVEILLKKKEYIERLTMVAVSAFIFSLSAVEYFLKQIIKASVQGPLVKWITKKKSEREEQGRKYHIYLSGIMNASKRGGLIDDVQHTSWKSMIWLRNAIMHNNAIVEEDTAFEIDVISFKIEANQMITHPLVNRPKIIRVLVNLTRSWIESFLKSHGF
jgi:hypothetical protein